MTTPATCDRGEAPLLQRTPRRDALRDLRTVAPGVIPFGMFLGMTVTITGTGIFAGLLGAPVVYAGSAQLTTITMLHLGSGLLTAVAAGAALNARFLLYGAALEPWFRDQPRWFRLLGPQFVLDQTYVSAAARPVYAEEGGRSDFRSYWLWLATSLLAVWSGAVSAGIVLAPLLPDVPHLVLVGTAMFVALLVPRLVSRTSCVAALAAAVTALLVEQAAPDVAILAGAAAGVVAAILTADVTRPEGAS